MHFISYIYCRIGAEHVGDRICVGVIHITEDDTLNVYISDKKLAVVKALTKHNVYELFKAFVLAVKENKKGVGREAIEYEAIHQNGLIKISAPSSIVGAKGQNYPKAIFDKHIDKTDFKLNNK